MNQTKKNIKGLILAGGAGKRLHPITKIISKQLLPVYNKPMIYYPLTILINSGITEIMIITTREDQESFKHLLGNGEEWGVKISYKIQEKPEGIAQSLLIAEDWIDSSSVALILGDNLFFGAGLNKKIIQAIENNNGATIFCIKVNDPERFGVIDVDKDLNILSIKEKPKKPNSNWAITGLYIYDSKASSYARNLKKSSRGEYEITDINLKYLDSNNLKVEFLDDTNFSWLDTGTFDSLLEASNFIKNNSK